MTREELIGRLKAVVSEIEPAATLWLYGSRARGTSEPDSDWDILILVPGSVTERRKQAIRHRLYELEWATDTVLSSIIHSQVEWSCPPVSATPFHKAVSRDRVQI